MGAYSELQGKAAIVTGATAGIGKAIALGLGREGVDVVVVGRDQGRGRTVEKMLAGTRSFFASCDVGRPEEVEATCALAVDRLGKVDILVNCAGGFPRPLLVTQYSVADWDEMLNVNLRSAFLFTRLVLPGMVEKRWGRIVNIASTAALGVAYLSSAL